MPKRRRLLGALGTAAGLGSAGCGRRDRSISIGDVAIHNSSPVPVELSITLVRGQEGVLVTSTTVPGEMASGEHLIYQRTWSLDPAEYQLSYRFDYDWEERGRSGGGGGGMGFGPEDLPSGIDGCPTLQISFTGSTAPDIDTVELRSSSAIDGADCRRS